MIEFLRTPDERFENLPGYSFSPNYLDVGDGLRMHYIDEGPKDGEVVLMLHGEPSWSYLYRTMIPVFVEAGYRAIAPDLIGFGRSDKPTNRDDYTYAKHMEWTTNWLHQLDLQGINLFCQDWGGLIGLRMATAEPDRFARIVAGNTMLPTGDVFENFSRFPQTRQQFEGKTQVSYSQSPLKATDPQTFNRITCLWHFVHLYPPFCSYKQELN